MVPGVVVGALRDVLPRSCLPCPRPPPGRARAPAHRADPRARRRHGHHDPAARPHRGGLPRRALRGAPERPPGLQRPALPDPPRHHRRHPRRLPRRRRRHHRDQLLQRDLHRAGGLRARAARPELNRAAAAVARAAADRAEAREPGHFRYVAGVIGPTNRTASLCPDVNDPGHRNVDFDTLATAYREAVEGAGGGRGGPPPGRDDLRHAERQGRHLRDRGVLRALGRAAAGR